MLLKIAYVLTGRVLSLAVLAFREDIDKWKAEFAAKKAAEEKPPEPAKATKKKRTRKVT